MFNMSAFLSYVFVVTFTPGPNNIMAMANAGKYGFKKSLEFNMGVFAGFVVIMTLSSYFNLLLFNLMPKVKIFMEVLGAGFMLYLAYKIMHTKEDLDTNKNQAAEQEKTIKKIQITENDLAIEEDLTSQEDPAFEEMNKPPIESKNQKWSLFFTGISLQFINPKAILYAITVVSNFIIPFYKSNLALLLFALLLSFISLLSTTSWAIFGALFNAFLSKYQKQFNIVMGLLLIYSAVSISGIMRLF